MTISFSALEEKKILKPAGKQVHVWFSHANLVRIEKISQIKNKSITKIARILILAALDEYEKTQKG